MGHHRCRFMLRASRFRILQGGLLESWAFRGEALRGPRGHVGFSPAMLSTSSLAWSSAPADPHRFRSLQIRALQPTRVYIYQRIALSEAEGRVRAYVTYLALLGFLIRKQTKPPGLATWASQKRRCLRAGGEAMGSLFSRARGGSEATEGDTELISEVKAATRAASTPGTPRAALPLPPNVPALALVSASSPPCARIAGPRWTSSAHTDF